MIGKLQRVPLREVWKHEAYDFTKWLEENSDVLGEALDLSFRSLEREKEAGAFSVDLVGEDVSGRVVVIENQLEKSNHDHLGKLVTYSAAVGAGIAIRIVADARPEHVAAIAWLNEMGGIAVYIVKVEAVRIGESAPAPLLTLIVGPTRTKLHSAVSPGDAYWLGARVGELSFTYAVWQHESGVEVYIDRGRDSGDETKRVFDSLLAEKKAIEDVFGEPLEWERLNDRRASRIRKAIADGGIRDEAKWSQIQPAMVDRMVHLEKAFTPFIAKTKSV